MTYPPQPHLSHRLPLVKSRMVPYHALHPCPLPRPDPLLNRLAAEPPSPSPASIAPLAVTSPALAISCLSEPLPPACKAGKTLLLDASKLSSMAVPYLLGFGWGKDTALGEVCWGVEIGGEFLTSWGWGRLRRTKRGNYAQQGSSAPPQKQRNPCLRSLHPLVSLRGHWHSRFGGEFCLVCSPLLSSTPPQTSSFSVLCTNPLFHNSSFPPWSRSPLLLG